MIWKSIILGFFCTVLFCLGIIFLKWIILSVGMNLFVLLLFLLTAICMLAIGEVDKDYDEDSE